MREGLVTKTVILGGGCTTFALRFDVHSFLWPSNYITVIHYIRLCDSFFLILCCNFYHHLHPAVGPPQITQQPDNKLNVVPGEKVEFIVGATTDAGDLTYQWKLERGGVKIDPLPEGVSGATTDTLTIPNVQERHSGEYSCAVSNAAGDTTSQPTQLTLRK